MSELSDCSPDDLGPFVEAANDEARTRRVGRARVHQKAGVPMCDECRLAWSWKNRRDYLTRKNQQ